MSLYTYYKDGHFGDILSLEFQKYTLTSISVRDVSVLMILRSEGLTFVHPPVGFRIIDPSDHLSGMVVVLVKFQFKGLRSRRKTTVKMNWRKSKVKE